MNQQTITARASTAEAFAKHGKTGRSLALFTAAAAMLLPLGARAGVVDLTGAINDLYNTGENVNSLNQDLSYYLIGVPSGQTEVKAGHHSFTGEVYAGSPTSATAKEVTPLLDYPGSVGTEYPKGTYTYQLSLTKIPVGATVTIMGDVIGDDAVTGLSGDADGILTTISGNGINGDITDSYTDKEEFSLVFTAGTTNAVDFSVYNSHGYTGLLVDDLEGYYTIVPEPSTWTLLLAGGGMLGLLGRRRLRQGY